MDSPHPVGNGSRSGSTCAARAAQSRGTALLLHTSPELPARPPRGTDVQHPLVTLAAEVERGLPKGWHVSAVRADEPDVLSEIEAAVARGSDRLVVVCLQPHFSAGEGRRALDVLYRCLSRAGGALHVETRPSWHDESEYIDALALGVTEGAVSQDISPLEARVLFCVRGEADDLGLSAAAERTAELVMARIGRTGSAAGVCIVGSQNRLRWPEEGPAVDQPILMCPLDPLDEPGSLAADVSNVLDIPGLDLRPCEPMASGERLVKTITLLVRRGRQPASHAPSRVLMRPAVDREELLSGMFMVGTSVPGALATEQARQSLHCSREQLVGVKRPHLETLDLLRDLPRRYPLAECWIWNTCSRFEVYGWFSPGVSAGDAERALKAITAEVRHGTDVQPATLLGRDAWSHMMRTAGGLNSGLIGDADVYDQFDASLRAARHAGTAHARCQEVSELVAAAIKTLRTTTPWGRFTRRYCDTALSLLPSDIRGLLANGRIIVVGGSTTSASSLESLRERFGVDMSNVTLFYRGQRSGPLMDRLVRAIGQEHLVCVDNYHEAAVARAVAGADVAILAADQREPFLDALHLGAAGGSPVLIDFNNFGSVAGAEEAGLQIFDADSIEAAIRELNHRTRVSDEFGHAHREAESWIAHWLATCFGSAPAASQSPARSRIREALA